MSIKEENDKSIKENEITNERLTIYRILDLYRLINKENEFNKNALQKIMVLVKEL